MWHSKWARCTVPSRQLCTASALRRFFWFKAVDSWAILALTGVSLVFNTPATYKSECMLCGLNAYCALWIRIRWPDMEQLAFQAMLGSELAFCQTDICLPTSMLRPAYKLELVFEALCHR